MPNTTRPFYPSALLHDAARCLAFIHQSKAHINRRRRLRAGAVSQLVDRMLLRSENPNPRKESEAPGLSFLAGLLEHAGLVAADEDALRLAPKALDWLGLPLQEQIEQLRQVWWQAPELSARWLPSTRRQRSLGRHWRSVVVETSRWVAGLPADHWTRAADLRTYLASQDLLQPTREGCNLPQVSLALEQQVRDVTGFLLRFALPALGLIEIDDGEELLLRPTAEGASWLHAALSPYLPLAAPPQAGEAAVEMSVPVQELHFPPPAEPPVTVDAKLCVAVGLAAPAAYTFDLAHFAYLLSPGPPALYRVTRQSVEQAAAWGYPVTQVSFLLARFSRGRLPPAAVEQLIAWQEEIPLITYEPGYCLRVAAPEILDALRQREPFRRRSQVLASGHEVWVSRSQAKDLFRYLRWLRYTLAPLDEKESRPAPPWTSFRHALPLVALLVALRTYQHLRSLVHGLADLGLQELEQALETALPPGDKAAAQRLLESHIALLEEPPGEGDEAQEDEETGGREDNPPPSPHLQAAIETGAPLRITYADTQARVTHRRVHPLRLEARWGREYLVARCELRQDERHFRLDRIIEVETGD